MSKGLFITGTGTEVGKTYVTGLILKKLTESGDGAAYFKAAMSGNVRHADGTLIPGDAQWVKTISGIAQPLEEMCPYVYENAVSPHLASRLEGNPVTWKVVEAGYQHLCSRYNFITVEGSGGILCPLCHDEEKLRLEDVIRRLYLPSLIVTDAGLGAINSVGLTAAYMAANKLSMKGIIFNHFHPGNLMEEDNLRMCEEITGLPVLACVQDGCAKLEMRVETLEAFYE